MSFRKDRYRTDYTCEACGRRRGMYADHSACSRKLQAANFSRNGNRNRNRRSTTPVDLVKYYDTWLSQKI